LSLKIISSKAKNAMLVRYIAEICHMVLKTQRE